MNAVKAHERDPTFIFTNETKYYATLFVTNQFYDQHCSLCVNIECAFDLLAACYVWFPSRPSWYAFP